jgi:FkbM family methyltransferase
VLSILNLAGDEKPGKIMFSSCNTASEVCAIDPDGKGISVDAISVESFMKDHAIDRIFWLAIDTEGHDPAVLRGAENILAAGRVEVLQVRP